MNPKLQNGCEAKLCIGCEIYGWACPDCREEGVYCVFCIVCVLCSRIQTRMNTAPQQAECIDTLYCRLRCMSDTIRAGCIFRIACLIIYYFMFHISSFWINLFGDPPLVHTSFKYWDCCKNI